MVRTMVPWYTCYLVPVAVKKFFMLETPGLYGLVTAAEVGAIVEREFLPEVNMLLSLSHPNVPWLPWCHGMANIFEYSGLAWYP
jgi:hypothetical protein